MEINYLRSRGDRCLYFAKKTLDPEVRAFLEEFGQELRTLADVQEMSYGRPSRKFGK